MELTEGLDSAPFGSGLDDRVGQGAIGGLCTYVGGSRLTNSFALISLRKTSPTRTTTCTRERLVDPRFTGRGNTFLISPSRDIYMVLYRRSRVEVGTFTPNLSPRDTCTGTGGISSIFVSHLPVTFSRELNFLATDPIGLNAKLGVSINLRLPTIRCTKNVNGLTSLINGLNFALHPLCNRSNTFCILAGRIALNVARGRTIRGVTSITVRVIVHREGLHTAVGNDRV